MVNDDTNGEMVLYSWVDDDWKMMSSITPEGSCRNPVVRISIDGSTMAIECTSEYAVLVYDIIETYVR